jgi:hypothetical protein
VIQIGEVADGDGPPALLDAQSRPVAFRRGSFSHF